MATVTLSTRDINVLEKIKDPEFDPAAGIVLDPSLPRDPQITDASTYQQVVALEKEIIRSIHHIETQLSQNQPDDAASSDSAVAGYQQCAARLDDLIAAYPTYASARNNRAQIARRLHGDAMLLSDTSGFPAPLLTAEREEKHRAATQALQDLGTSITLLTPPTLHTPMSAQAARTLSMAHTQRAAVYMRTAKLLSVRRLDVDAARPESGWSKLDFEEAASRDLALGGRYGNQIAKELAVSVNPTAKLCGQMVREAMKKEYGPEYAQ